MLLLRMDGHVSPNWVTNGPSRNEAIIVEFRELFVLNGTFITCSGGSHH